MKIINMFNDVTYALSYLTAISVLTGRSVIKLLAHSPHPNNEMRTLGEINHASAEFFSKHTNKNPNRSVFIVVFAQGIMIEGLVCCKT